jgi:hypothetical protein
LKINPHRRFATPAKCDLIGSLSVLATGHASILYQVPYDEPLLNGDQQETSEGIYKVIVNTRPPVSPITASQSLVPKPRVAASFQATRSHDAIGGRQAPFAVFS